MKHLLQATAIISFISMTSCTKVVNIDLNKSNPQYVVEAEVTNADSVQSVHIGRSVNFSEVNDFPAVTNAFVVISDDAGHIDTLIQNEPGYYTTTRIKGVPGHKYDLQILVDGHQFSATSTMPPSVSMDTLKVAVQLSFGREIKAPQVTFYEPLGKGNFYYFMVYRNHHRVRTIYIDNDLANDGVVIERFLPDADSTYRSGDEVYVDLQCITKEVYDYYFSLQQTIDQSSATPANPVTNIKGGNVLGYFSAHTANRRKLLVD